MNLFDFRVVLFLMDAFPFFPQLNVGGAEDFLGQTRQAQGSRDCDQNQKQFHAQTTILSFLNTSFANQKMI